MVAVDLDGTLFFAGTQVSERSIVALQCCRRLGIRVAVATARPYLSVKHRLHPRLHVGDHWICSNGAAIYHGDRCTYKDAVPEVAAKEVLARLNASPDKLIVSMEMGGRLYIDTPLYTGPTPVEVANLYESVDGPVTKILVTMADDQDQTVVLPDLPDCCRADLTDGGRIANIMSGTATKESALGVLLDELGLGFDEVMAFGDDVTDIQMLRRSGVGVAMGNAVPQVQAVADRVTLSNEEDGVAIVLEELISTRS